ncbi:hypothetical protein T265_07383 [Opisthorchis viverrini]|uniref:Uncharacterized protein n=1 Tax=Opisthorchis viverrini TaxID=6198 RepID=A0A074ZD28_OPIVI|nr:hypothetical protein T265_07383 [Opisthorchis viverrini]KER25093.1 hypothetical protein T265_07383 [Opisthorchis viverrini]
MTTEEANGTLNRRSTDEVPTKHKLPSVHQSQCSWPSCHDLKKNAAICIVEYKGRINRPSAQTFKLLPEVAAIVYFGWRIDRCVYVKVVTKEQCGSTTEKHSTPQTKLRGEAGRIA